MTGFVAPGGLCREVEFSQMQVTNLRGQNGDVPSNDELIDTHGADVVRLTPEMVAIRRRIGEGR